ncbi:MAG: YcgN family cysteine cluster protein [Alphaproteobacteria bacterium]|nr:YcgN family cysteine cluster protein [Alphaproteobacteria bacterium]
MGSDSPVPFWKRKTLPEMTRTEWESLCDGCARCCLLKLEDIDTGEIAYTDIACKLLDSGACRCSDYKDRQQTVPDCVVLKPDNIGDLSWMPSSCAYRMIAEGKDLAWWHPLVSGDANSVHEAGISVRGKVVPEQRGDDPEDRIVTWPE